MSGSDERAETTADARARDLVPQRRGAPLGMQLLGRDALARELLADLGADRGHPGVPAAVGGQGARENGE